MENLDIFISVGGTCNDKQEQFVRAIEDRLRSENLTPNTVGRNKFSADAPLKAVMQSMKECSGTLIIALERTYCPQGLEKRGGPNETSLKDVKIPTPWNQIEAALAYSHDHPLMLIVEEGLKSEGLLEKGYDWHVMWVKPEISALTTPEFNGVFASWKKKVEEYKSRNQAIKPKAAVDPTTLTIGELINNLKPSNLWGILGALVAMLAGAFALGQHFAK